MSLVRVFENPDGHLRVLMISPNQRNANETEAETLERVAADVTANDPSLAGLPYHDMENTDLPPRLQVDAHGDDYECRNAWRRNGTAVLIDDTRVGPNWSRVAKRLRRRFNARTRLDFADLWAHLEQAIADEDSDMLQRVYDRLKQHMETSPTPKLTPAQWSGFQNVLTVKRLPITL